MTLNIIKDNQDIVGYELMKLTDFLSKFDYYVQRGCLTIFTGNKKDIERLRHKLDENHSFLLSDFTGNQAVDKFSANQTLGFAKKGNDRAIGFYYDGVIDVDSPAAKLADLIIELY